MSLETKNNKQDYSQDGCLARIIQSYVDYEDPYKAIEAGFEPTKEQLKNINLCQAIEIAVKKYKKDPKFYINLIYLLATQPQDYIKRKSCIKRGLYIASEINNIYLVKYFMFLGANDWHSAMGYAAKGGHKKLIKYFLKKIKTDKTSIDWRYAIDGAIDGKHICLVKYLIEEAEKDKYFKRTNIDYSCYLLSVEIYKINDLIDYFKEKIKNK